jgi:hypothetical protein
MSGMEFPSNKFKKTAHSNLKRDTQRYYYNYLISQLSLKRKSTVIAPFEDFVWTPSQTRFWAAEAGSTLRYTQFETSVCTRAKLPS